jgi:hypothetical protein
MLKSPLAIIGVFVAVAVLSAPSVRAQVSAEPAYGSVAGTVKDALTRRPVADVNVTCGASGATTDASGKFMLPQVESGRQWISAYDESRAISAGTYAVVPAGGNAEVEIFVKLGGSISGKVFDEDRRPVAGISVLLLARKFDHGQLVYQRELTAQTTKLGEYRLQPVHAERSYLLLVKRPLAVTEPPAKSSEAAAVHERVLRPTYYPNSPDVQDAQPVVLLPGESREGVNIRMAGSDSFCLDGKLEATGRRRPDSLTITEHMALLGSSTFAPANIKLSAQGQFSACGLHPGDYFLTAQTAELSNPPTKDFTSAFATVSVIDADLIGLKLTARAPVSVTGDVAWDPAPTGQPAETPVRIGISRSIAVDNEVDQPGAPPSLSAGFWYGDRIKVPGAFTVGGLAAGGEYQFSTGDLPRGCYVKEASDGGASLLDGPLRITGVGSDATIRVVLACDGGFLSARVSDGEGNPVSNVRLFLMPEDTPSEAALSSRVRVGEVEKGWSEPVGPLPPGKYLALASELDLDGTAEPVFRLWQVRSKATEVDVAPGATGQITLTVTDTE